MSDLLIKPLRAYEDRGVIRDVDDEPYAAPVWLAKELAQLKLCEIVSGDDSGQSSGLKLAKKGQRWVVVDADGAQIGDFIGKRDEAEAELAKLLAANPPSSGEASSAGVDHPPHVPPSADQPNGPPPQE